MLWRRFPRARQSEELRGWTFVGFTEAYVAWLMQPVMSTLCAAMLRL
jgi:hypothetical protein